jgi:hypothetical protein
VAARVTIHRCGSVRVRIGESGITAQHAQLLAEGVQNEARKDGLAWATFQVLRKTNASLSAKAGVEPKVSADQRGHGLGVSMEVYTISDHQQKREAVKQLESMIGRPREARKSA